MALGQRALTESDLPWRDNDPVFSEIKTNQMNPKSCRFSLLLTLCFFPLTVTAQSGVPRFSDYAVNEHFAGKTAPLVLAKQSRQFCTRLREAAQEKPNFAGHFIVTSWGCGAECVQGAIIDARTGHVFMLPTTLCCWGNVDDKFNPIEYRLNSKLIILSGARNEKEGDYAARYYKFENNKLVLIKTVPQTPKQFQ